jgi:hypothetical protein
MRSKPRSMLNWTRKAKQNYPPPARKCNPATADSRSRNALEKVNVFLPDDRVFAR